jgi:hypothetical protein
MALVRALHGWRPWPNLSSMGAGHGGSPERKGGSRGEQGGGHHGGLHDEGPVPWGLLRSPCSACCCAVCEEEEEEREKKKEKEGKEKNV